MDKGGTQSRQARRRLPFRKKLAFGLLATLLFYATLEILLVAFDVQPVFENRDPFVGFESSIPLFVEASRDDIALLHTAKNKLAFFNLQQFPKRKSSNTYRIFCLGGSTTYGRPYDDSTSFVGWLRELLQLADETHNWEVINAGGISYASYRVANVLDELCAYEPDLFIIYTGHNEFLEERTYRKLAASPVGWRRMTALLFRTRTFSLVSNLVSRDSQPADTSWKLPTEVDTILDHAVGPTDYHRDAELRADVLEHFQFNLSRCINTARAAGARVVLVKPACNVKDFSPFKSEFLAAPDDSQRRWIELFSQAVAQAESGNVTNALASLEQAEQIDGARADLHFMKGKLLFSEQRYEAARDSFVTAIDQDICPLRAIPAIGEIIERTALETRTPLVDFPGILEDNCNRSYGHRSPGNEYFLDHVHPTIEANRLLALALVEVLLQTKTFVPNNQWRDEVVALASRRIESRVNPELQARALTNLAQVLSWAGKQEEAGPLAVEAVRLRTEQGLSDDPESMFYAALHYSRLGAEDQALTLLEKVIRLQPDHAQAHRRLATLYYDRLEYGSAESHCKALLRLDPSDEFARHLLELVRSKKYSPMG